MTVIDPPVFSHDPVLRDEIVAAFESVPAGVVVDGTLGGGGHTAALLAAHDDISVVGVDRDPVARAAAAARLVDVSERVHIVAATSDEGILEAASYGDVTGVLLDLGVSSPQIDEAERGFSYSRNGPLDMRMDTENGVTAADVLRSIDVGDLARALRQLSDEPHAHRIARAVLAEPTPTTTAELADRVRSVVPARDRRRGDPSKRTFQALRILVNDELTLLESALEAAIDVLAPGGRLAVISYHSGEDRLVKSFFRDLAEPARHLPRHLPVPPELEPTVDLITRKAITPSSDELARNPRSASARLRVAERTDRPRSTRSRR